MKPTQLPDYGDHLWMIEVEPRKRVEVPRLNAQGQAVMLNGAQVIDIQYVHGKVLRRGSDGVIGTDGDMLVFDSEQAAQDFIDGLKPEKPTKPEPAEKATPAAKKTAAK